VTNRSGSNVAFASRAPIVGTVPMGLASSSPSPRHASAHARESGHPIVRSAEPGEDWEWCYVDEVMFRLEG